jgi:hypothetical protein
MDHSTTFPAEHLINFLYVAGIITYGVRQYLKRERAHKAFIRRLLAGEGAIQDSPIEETKPALWRLLNIVAMEALLLGGIIYLVCMRPRILYGGGVMYILAAFFLVLFALLMPVLIREIKRYRVIKAL